MKYITILSFLLLLSSCQNVKNKTIETDGYYLKIDEVSKAHSDYSNTFGVNPIKIDAENISLEDLIKTIFKNDNIQFNVKNKKLLKENIAINLIIKKSNIESKKEAFDAILESLDLKNETDNINIYDLKIADTTSLYKYYSDNANTNNSKIYKSKDSISINNLSLKKLSELISEKFNIVAFSTNNNAIIDYNFKFENLKDFENDLKNNLGLELFDTNKKQITYTITD